MTDINPPPGQPAHMLYLRDEELRRGLELLFFANRDIGKTTDTLLANHGLGRAHHRVIYFIGRHPDISVSGLLSILGITKQSLGRVLQPLQKKGFIEQTSGTHDRRQRLLRLTEAGIALESELSKPQRDRMAKAYRAAGPDAVAGFRTVLAKLLDDELDRSETSAIGSGIL